MAMGQQVDDQRVRRALDTNRYRQLAYSVHWVVLIHYGRSRHSSETFSWQRADSFEIQTVGNNDTGPPKSRRTALATTKTKKYKVQ